MKTDATLLANNTQHFLAQHVASVCMEPPHRARGATLKVGGGGGLTSDSKWGGGGVKTHFLQ